MSDSQENQSIRSNNMSLIPVAVISDGSDSPNTDTQSAENQPIRSNDLSPTTPVESSSQGNDPTNTQKTDDTTTQSSTETTPPQEPGMRQPQTLQDLLKISTSLQSSIGGLGSQEELTEERAEFLKNALEGMTVDLGPEMKQQLEILKEVQTRPHSYVEANQVRYQEALERMEDFLYELDLAQIFYQLGGLEITTPLLRSDHGFLRSAAANIIAECCKNNYYCQLQSVSDEVFGPLMEMAASDPNKDAKFKAIGALSAIVRANTDGVQQFNKFNGIPIVLKALNCGCERIVNRTLFLIVSLCETDKAVKSKLTESDLIPNLITLLRLSDKIVKEYVLRCLMSITRNNPPAQQICHQHDLETYLSSLSKTSTEPSYQDVKECADTLMTQLQRKKK